MQVNQDLIFRLFFFRFIFQASEKQMNSGGNNQTNLTV